MAEQILQIADAGPAFQQMGGEGVAQGMRSDPFIQARPPGGLANGLLKRGIEHMMAPPHTAAMVPEQVAGGKHPKPLEFLARFGPLALESFGQFHPWQLLQPILLVQGAHSLPLLAQGGLQ